MLSIKSNLFSFILVILENLERKLSQKHNVMSSAKLQISVLGSEGKNSIISVINKNVLKIKPLVELLVIVSFKN